MSPKDVIAGRIGQARAAALIEDLLEAGFVIVDRGAIGRAQREAVAQFKEDGEEK